MAFLTQIDGGWEVFGRPRGAPPANIPGVSRTSPAWNKPSSTASPCSNSSKPKPQVFFFPRMPNEARPFPRTLFLRRLESWLVALLCANAFVGPPLLPPDLWLPRNPQTSGCHARKGNPSLFKKGKPTPKELGQLQAFR